MKPTVVIIVLGMLLAVAYAVWRASARRAAGPADAKSPAFATLDEVANWLERNRRLIVRRYSTFDFGREMDERNISAVVSEKLAEPLLAELRGRLGPGLLAFLGTSRWLGQEQHAGVELVVAPGQSQFDVLRVARSDAANYDLTTEDLIRRLRDYDDRFGIDVFHAEADTVRFRMRTLPGEMSAFAQELYAFCPDIVDQGCGSVDALAAEVKKTGVVMLWWD